MRVGFSPGFGHRPGALPLSRLSRAAASATECPVELWLPQLRDHLSGQHLPMLHVEFEAGPAIAQQTLNRIEAFVEMLK